MLTEDYFDIIIKSCREVFAKKAIDYGTSWRIMRPQSLTDQIYIKARRIRSIETGNAPLINEGVLPEYQGIINYSVMGLIQLEKGFAEGPDLTADQAKELYDKYILLSKELMIKKNHDYGEAWKMMRISSLTDLILSKLNRIKQIEDNNGKTIISEGIDAGYYDIINYSVFALIKLDEAQN